MKLKYILMAVASLGLFTSCESDDPSLVVAEYHKPTTFVLNTPQFANGVYDLAQAETVNLTFSQPDYGYAAVCDYTIEVSKSEQFAEGEMAAVGTTYHSCDIDIDANDLALAICTAYGWESDEDIAAALSASSTGTIPVYVRVQAKVSNALITGSEITSNVISINTIPYFALPAVELPTTMYMIGDFCGGDWGNAATMTVDASNSNMFWCVRYVKADTGWFKFNYNNSWDGNQFGYDAENNTYTSHVDGVEMSGVDDGSGAMNIVVNKAGWYMFGVTVSLDGRTLKYNVEIYSPDFYIYGVTNGGTWDKTADWKFSIPEDENGVFTSPALAAAGEVRIALVTDPAWGGDWWAHELTVKTDGTIFYRGTNNIANNWAEDMGAEYSLTGEPGKKVTLDFNTGTGSLK